MRYSDSRRLRDNGDSYYTYVFPELEEEDISVGVNEYHLDYYGEDTDGSVMGGKLSDLKRFGDEYLQGYSLAKNYLERVPRKNRLYRYM